MVRSVIVGWALVACSAAWAKVDDVSATGFKVSHEVALKVRPARVWRSLERIEQWWDPEHTWSGDAGNLRLKPEAGGCFCERWGGQSVEHARVIWAHPGARLRMLGALGPLQEWGASGVAEFVIEPRAGGSTLRFSYTVSGDARFQFDQVAPVVDRVLGTQVERLVRHAETGSPVPGR